MHWYRLLCGMIFITFALGSEKFRTQWEAFKSMHGRRYKSDVEELFRFKIFTENSLLVARHNEKYAKGLVSYKLGMNKFGDLLPYEFVEIVNRYLGKGSSELATSPWQNKEMSIVQQPATSKNDNNLPLTIDWREKGAVTPVKNQGQCGSCWAFSAVGSLEGQHFRKTGKLVRLSEQNLVDCSGEYGNHGCKNGSIEFAYRYIMENGGVATESSYPYKGVESTCKFRKEDVGSTITGYVNIQAGSERDLEKALANVGPISAAIDANHQSFQFYKEGLYDEPDCSSWLLTHGVLVVGYGEKNGKKHWLVKNSWSDQWGDNGFIFMSRDKKNQCGIASAASYPLV